MCRDPVKVVSSYYFSSKAIGIHSALEEFNLIKYLSNLMKYAQS